VEPISLSIPFLVVSTKISIFGEMDMHILTPFGLADITFHVTSKGEDKRQSFRAVSDSDTSVWMLDEMTFDEFKESLFRFVEGMVKRRFGMFIGDYSPFHVHVTWENVVIAFPW